MLLKGLPAAALFALAACASIGSRPADQVVAERAQARWDDLVKGDYVAAYGFLSPGSKAVQNQENYVGSLRKGFWKAAKVEKVACGSEQACEVDLSIEYEFQGHRTRTPLRETWVKEGAEWWYVKK